MGRRGRSRGRGGRGRWNFKKSETASDNPDSPRQAQIIIKQKTQVAAFEDEIAYVEDIARLRDENMLSRELYGYFIKVYASRLPLLVEKTLEVIRGNEDKTISRSKAFVVFDTNIMLVD